MGREGGSLFHNGVSQSMRIRVDPEEEEPDRDENDGDYDAHYQVRLRFGGLWRVR